MITKEELSKIAEVKNISLTNTERDYLQEIILFNLYKGIKDELVFKGGTALYKIYGLNRFSQDLDFTLTKRRFKLKNLVAKMIDQVWLLGIKGKIKEFREYKNEVNIRLVFRGPLYNGSKESLVLIPLNTSLRERVVKASNELIISSYREIPSFEVYVMGEQEIAAEKIRAILTREKARDVYDLWFLLKKGIKLNFDLVEKKLRIHNKKFSKKEFIAAINRKEKMWEVDLRKLTIGTLPDFRRIKKGIIGKI